MSQPVKIGLVSVSDRASQGVYEDKGLPALPEPPATSGGVEASMSNAKPE